jgi:DNA polymerase bacteriophage-type
VTILNVDATIRRLQQGHLEAVLKAPQKGDPQGRLIVPLHAKHVNTLLRCTLTASPGRLLVVADFSQVEARALAWAADDHDALARFAVYDSGDHDNGDPYAAMAAKIFGGNPGEYTKGTPGEYPGRHIGKQAELGCGYGMGKDKFYQKVIDDGGNWADIIQAAGLTGQIDAQDMAQQVVDAWRELHHPITCFWKELQAAAVDVTEGGAGSSCSAGPFTWHNIDELVLCELPSGRSVCYRGMRCDFEESKFGGPPRPSLSYHGRKGRERTYGGKLTENVIQGMCRDLMAEALVRAEAEGLDPVHTIHDEIICDVAEEDAEAAAVYLEELMCVVSPWAVGMPIAAEKLRPSFRYGK